MKLKFKYFIPLVLFIIPTIIITTLLFIFDAPPSPAQLIGFIILLIAACITYYMGLKRLLDDLKQD